MEYVKIEGQFPKFSHWSQETDSDDPEQKK